MTSDSKLEDRLRDGVRIDTNGHVTADTVDEADALMRRAADAITFQKTAITGIGKLAFDENGEEWKSRALAAEAKVWRLEAANDELTNKLTKQIDEWFKVADERRAKVERLERALKPFADEATELALKIRDDAELCYPDYPQLGLTSFTVADLRRARALLSQEVKNG